MDFVDANIIIKAFVDDDDSVKCQKIISGSFVTDTLCLIEAQHAIARIKQDKSFAAICMKSLYKQDCQIVSIDKNLLFEALKRIDKYDLNIFDLLHYVAALFNKCTTIRSYDKDFDKVELKRTEP